MELRRRGLWLCLQRPLDGEYSRDAIVSLSENMRCCPQCNQILADSAGHCPDDGLALSPADTKTGQLLSGQFRVLEKIGEGASADVYRGYQLGVERVVALKILTRSAASSDEFVARFVREARAAAHLAHENIITVYQIGRTPAGLPFIAMEWIAGGPIGRGSHAPKLGDYEAVVALAKQIASALSEAHSAGIIHRDLKPANLLVANRGGKPKVTVVDFGIAKFLDETMLAPGQTHLTRLGAVYGTPSYLSPEQASAREVDIRSDLYSLGVVLYELVCGHLPFLTQGVVLLVDHMQTSAPDLGRRVPDAPDWLCTAIMRLLSKDPEDRPGSAQAFLDELAPAAPEEVAFRVPHDSGHPSINSIGPMDRQAARPRPGFAVAAGMLCLAFLAMGSGQFAKATDAVAQASPKAVELVHEPDHPHVTAGPQRALMVSSGGYALRVLVPETLRAGQPQPLAVEVWDPAGRPISLPSLVLRFADADGYAEGVAVPAGSTLGRYDTVREFEKAGDYSMEVLTQDAEVPLRVYFEVKEPAGPNT